MIENGSIIFFVIFIFSLFIKFLIIQWFSLTTMACFRCNLFVDTHTWNNIQSLFLFFLIKSDLLACSISKFSIGLKWWTCSEDCSGLAKGGDAIQLLLIADESIRINFPWKDKRFRRKFYQYWKQKPNCLHRELFPMKVEFCLLILMISTRTNWWLYTWADLECEGWRQTCGVFLLEKQFVDNENDVAHCWKVKWDNE